MYATRKKWENEEKTYLLIIGTVKKKQGGGKREPLIFHQRDDNLLFPGTALPFDIPVISGTFHPTPLFTKYELYTYTCSASWLRELGMNAMFLFLF